MPEMEYVILDEWYRWITQAHNVHVDLFGEMMFMFFYCKVIIIIRGAVIIVHFPTWR